MDDRRFDDLTRALAGGLSRRRLLRGLAAGTLGLAVGRRPAGAACPPDQVERRGLGCVCKATGRQPHADGQCPCPSGQVRCGDVCLKANDDLANCGGCGIVCSTSPDPCLIAVCQAGTCGFKSARDGTPCDDGDACTTGDVCRAGRCVGTPTVCDDGLACTASACGPDGACVHPLAAGWCLIDGVCVAAGTRDPGNPCRVCDPGQSQTAWSNAARGTACDDATLCNGREACDGAGQCVAGVPVACPDPLPCQAAGVCDAATGKCHYEPLEAGTVCRVASEPCQNDAVCDGSNPDCPANPIAVGRECDDGDPCTEDDVCQADGSCAGTPIVCADDGLDCTETRCDPERGCVNDLRPGFCLIDGVCYTAGDRHSTGCFACDPSASTSNWTMLAHGTPCDEDNLCVQDATCQEGVCVPGTATDCGPSTTICRRSECDPETGACVETVVVGPDRKGCTICEYCLDTGECQVPLKPASCGDCRTCDLSSGACVLLPAGTDCGSTCDFQMTCLADGSCAFQRNPQACFNLGECSAASCDEETRQCVETGAKDGQACGGDACHVCAGGKCAPKSCGRCERCDPELGCVPCSSCCNGFCDWTTCGSSCCAPGTVCCTNNSGNQLCRPENEVCDGACFFEPKVCCGRDVFGAVHTCPLGWQCCFSGGSEQCCPPGQRCGVFGCM